MQERDKNKRLSEPYVVINEKEQLAASVEAMINGKNYGNFTEVAQKTSNYALKTSDSCENKLTKIINTKIPKDDNSEIIISLNEIGQLITAQEIQNDDNSQRKKVEKGL
ncbi:unnamed protein product [Thelazia callipaeda]|uniref:Uncharacterized protein n=1 Tax=Thelazia callipaeda TaxID=103827 RepID=A0A0N5DB87_THECL|nr:unnamed protein product [Thelazia callipaeda]